jgi:hypothetical protein
MKAFAFLPAAAAAILAFNISAASSQDVCVNEFTACMNSCGLKPSKSMQDGCFAGCETKNGMCSERVFGKRPSGSPVAAPAPAAVQAKDAMAQKEVPLAREEQAAPEQEPAAPEAAPEPRKAPQQRVPVRR